MRFQPPRIIRLDADHHGEVVAFGGSHGKQVRLRFRDVIHAFYLCQRVLRQNVFVTDHIDVAHRAARPQLERVVDARLQHLGLPLHGIANRLHHEEQEERHADERSHENEAQLAPPEIAYADADHAHAVLRIASTGLNRKPRMTG
jgi:hypothetical protein